MNHLTNIQIPVEQATADALADDRRGEAIGRLVDRIVQRGADNPLASALEAAAAEARAGGLTDFDIDEELTVYNTERRG